MPTPIINRSYFDASQRGRDAAQLEQANALRQQAMQQDITQQGFVNNLLRSPDATPEQLARAGRPDIGYAIDKIRSAPIEQQQAAAKQFAEQMTNAARYSQQAPPGQTKAFIERNFPMLAQTYGPDWATASDDQVRAELNGIAAKFGVQAGIGPATEKGTSGAMYKVIDPQTGRVTYATAQDARGQTPYQYTPPAGSKQAPPRGYRWSSDGQSVEPIPGGPNDPNAPNRPTAQPKPPTEGDKRARVMYFSMKNAEKQLEQVTGSDTSNLGQAILGKVGLDVAKSDEYKRYEAGGLRWAANLLYLKSGATATPDEIRSTWLQFFPQPGDGPSVKAQKDEARQQEMFAINDTYTFERGAAPAAPPAGKQQAPVQVKSEAEYNALPSGAQYIAPDGSTRRKK